MRKLIILYNDNSEEACEESHILSGWNDIDDRGIFRLDFLTKSQSILLTGYDFYNVVSQIKEGIFIGIYLMGKLGGIVDVTHLHFSDGTICRDQLSLEQGTEDGSLGWRKGEPMRCMARGTFVVPLR